ncbi:MAG: Hsp20/alpha crystallin family protein [Halobacteriota archaeon]
MSNNTHKSDNNTQQNPEMQGALPEARRTQGQSRLNLSGILDRVHWPLWWPWAPIESSAEEPATDVAETDGEFKVTIELPGVAKENIEISATDDSVELTALKTEVRAQPQAKYVSKERGCESFKRVIALSEEIIPDEAKATFENGILTLILKKKPPEPARERVKVKIE